MSQITEFLSPGDLAKISNLQILARLVVEGFTTGLHRSPHKGFSVEFKQHRQYVPGDEIRHLDWKVFGKTDRFYIREYEEETNLRATLLLDMSGSMGYGAPSRQGGAKGERVPTAPPYRDGAPDGKAPPFRDGAPNKLHYATRVAASLAYLMLQQADSVGLVTFDSHLRQYIPPRARPSHLKVLIDTLSAATPGGETELGKVMHELAPKLHRRGLVIIISDCFGDVSALMKGLAHFRHARHEVIIFQIWDRDELEFPFTQWTKFDSLEDSQFHMVDPHHLRQAYLENLAKYRAELKKGCSQHRIDLVPMVTDEPYAEALAKYLALRRRR
ncbi:MAG: DUF58 domain-containing protein [Phycisphaeraceae bacterium]